MSLRLIKAGEVKASADSDDGEFAYLTSKLQPGTYTLIFEPDEVLETGDEDLYNSEICTQPNVDLQFSLKPLGQFVQPVDISEYELGFPELDFDEALREHKSIKTTQIQRYFDISRVPTGKTTVLKEYEINMPVFSEEDKARGVSGLGSITISIHHDFWISGGLGIILQDYNSAKRNTETMACLDENTCTIGKHYEKNTVTASAMFAPGRYSLAIIYTMKDNEFDLMRRLSYKVPFTLHMTLESLNMQEDRFNCQAARLPHSFNLPGMIDESGFLRYKDHVLADLYATILMSNFTIQEDSVFRLVTMQPKGIDIDISLRDANDKEVAITNSAGKSEGILKEIKAGSYSLVFSFMNSIAEDPAHVYCETFLLEVGISPFTAVQSLSDNLNLQECRDDTEELNTSFSTLEELKNNTRFNTFLTSNSYYKLPIKSLKEGEEVIYSTEFTLPLDSYGYFEIFSDFVMSDLTISLEKKLKTGSTVVHGYDNMALGNLVRDKFSGRIKKGTYTLKIRTGPTAKAYAYSSNQMVAVNSREVYRVLPACAAFQMKVQVFPVSGDSLKKWKCEGHDVKLLPATLNNLAHLGIRGTSQDIIPATSYYSDMLLAPDSYKNETNNLIFYTDSESIFNIVIESDGSPMKIQLRQGQSVVASDGESNSRSPPIYSISTKLSQHTTYILDILYYPKDYTKCHTYTANLYLAPISRFPYTAKCSNNSPDNSMIKERLLDNLPWIFNFSLDKKVSSLIEEPQFSYKQTTKPGYFEVPFVVTSELSILTGHLMTSLMNAGYSIEVYKGTELIDWASYMSTTRIEIEPFPVDQGDYSIVIRELNKPVVPSCVKMLGSVLLEDKSLFNTYEAITRKVLSCGYIDQPDTLDLVGQLENGKLHWHKELPMDTGSGVSMFYFTVTEESIVRAYIKPMKNIQFRVSIVRAENKYEEIETELIKSEEDSLYKTVSEGKYYLEILYSNNGRLPHRSACPTYEIDLQILPVSDFNTLAENYSCDSKPAKKVINGSMKGSEIYTLSHSQLKSSTITLNLDSDSTLHFQLSYENALSGYLWMNLYDSKSGLLERSYSSENYSELHANLRAGSYSITLNSTGNKEPCFPILLTYTITTEEVGEICDGNILPNSLVDHEASVYGGPQNSDGQISFYGEFVVQSDQTTDLITIKAPEALVVRILTISGSRELRIESTIYSDEEFNNALGYSKSQSSYGSFILELLPRNEPYYLQLNFVQNRATDDCNTYELFIVAEPREAVSNWLECRLTSHQNVLPPSSITLARKNSVIGNSYAVFKAWMLGDEKMEMPEGVVSTPGINSVFLYDIDITVPTTGLLSSAISYDFLTNDMGLTLYQGSNVVARSEWNILEDNNQEQEYDFSSSFAGVEVKAGNYKLRIRQSVAQNHLAQMFSEIDSCFMFNFGLEYIVTSIDEEIPNYLLLVEPDQLPNLNPSSDLKLKLTFEDPLSLIEKSSLKRFAYLESTKNERVYPIKVMLEKNQEKKIELSFIKDQLQQGTCYELRLDTSVLDLKDGARMPVDDEIKHTYCTLSCHCNPKSRAICDTNLKCVCPSPYMGPTCHECEEGFNSEAGICVKAEGSIDELPYVVEVTSESTEIQPDETVYLQVKFSAPIYTSDYIRINKRNGLDILQKVFRLFNSKENKYIKPVSVYPLGTGTLRWQFEWSYSDLSPGTYTVTMLPANLYDSDGREFRPVINYPTFNIKAPVQIEDTKSEITCLNGVIVGNNCKCNEGYSGPGCSRCAEGYEKQKNKCVKIDIIEEKEAVDSNAYLKEVTPKGNVNVTKGMKTIEVNIELSTQAFTNERRPIDYLTNSDVIINAFRLMERGSRTLLKATKVTSNDKDGKKWTLSFDSSKLKEGAKYKLVQLPDVLFNSKNKPFAMPDSSNLPQFSTPNSEPVEETIPPKSSEPSNTASNTSESKNTTIGVICNNHGVLFNKVCQCDRGYEGLNCEKCAEGFTMNNFSKTCEGRLFPSQSQAYINETQSDYSNVIIGVVVFCICIGAIYLINRSRQSGYTFKYEPIEMKRRHEPEDEEDFNLHSTKFDHVRFRPEFEDTPIV